MVYDLIFRMRKRSFYPFLVISALVVSQCDQNLTASKDQPLVDYVLVVTDSVTQAPLKSVFIQVTTNSGDTASYYTDSLEGRAVLSTVASARTLFHLGKAGYNSLDVIDTVNSQPDTVFNRALLRLLHVKMVASAFGQVGPATFPKDTLSAGDTLVFRFNQPVVNIEKAEVRLTNLSGNLWIDPRLDSTKKVLRITQKDGDWLPGKHYDYELVLRDAQGNIFKAPNDSTPSLRGSFYVREQSGVDTGTAFPTRFRLAYFNSGKFSRFDSLNVETSPLPDSTTRFARLKWDWPQGRRIDSIVVLIKDSGAAAPSWTVMTTFPGSLDSVTLDFADMYSTRSGISQKPVFPLLTSATAEIHLRLVAKQGLNTLDKFDTALASITQGMGPSVVVMYRRDHVFNILPDAQDSIEIQFADPEDSTRVVAFDTTHVKPALLPVDRATLTWSWISPSLGRLYYSFNGNPPAHARFRVDMNGQLLNGRPIWMRNRADGLELP
jgi:hypothetical protein